MHIQKLKQDFAITANELNITKQPDAVAFEEDYLKKTQRLLEAENLVTEMFADVFELLKELRSTVGLKSKSMDTGTYYI